jgi:hypothetical protein
MNPIGGEEPPSFQQRAIHRSLSGRMGNRSSVRALALGILIAKSEGYSNGKLWACRI